MFFGRMSISTVRTLVAFKDISMLILGFYLLPKTMLIYIINDQSTGKCQNNIKNKVGRGPILILVVAGWYIFKP